MKSLLLSLLIILSTTSFANTINFKCKSVDNLGFHKFDAHGVISMDDSNNVEGVLIVSLQKADAIESLQTYEDVKVKGYVRHFRAGEVTKEAFNQVVLSTNIPYLKALNLLIDFEDKSASKIISIDNFTYRSNCKTL